MGKEGVANLAGGASDADSDGSFLRKGKGQGGSSFSELDPRKK